jgi:hypothetical protein
MAIRGFKTISVRPKGLTDGVDGTNLFPGAMESLSNLIPAPNNPQMWVPRPASFVLTTFHGFNSPGEIECLRVVGNIAYGLIASGAYASRSQPFAYNIATNTFLSISGVTAGNLPASLSTAGDWVPPTCDVVGNRVVFTHPGFSSGSNFFGWLDISGFTSSSITGATNGTNALTSLSFNALQAGWNIGMAISSSAGDIPAGTTITAIAVNGLSATLSAAATGSHAGVILTVYGGTTAAPQWGAGNTNGNALVSIPVAVKNFTGRAWFAVANGRQFSDSGNATQITNAGQALTNSNGLPDTAFGGLPVYQTTGGVLQTLIAFQGASQMVMITGDFSASAGSAGALAVNSVGTGQGTIAPNSIVNTNKGLVFVASDGLRMIDQGGNITPPIGADGQGVSLGFLEAVFPSRICAAFNGDTYRASVQNGGAQNQPHEEYWYHLSRKVWSGAHTFPASLIQPWQGSAGNGFIIAPYGIPGQLWQSNSTPGPADSLVENGLALTWEFSTTLLPDGFAEAENVMVQATVMCCLQNAQTIQVSARNEIGAVLDTPTITATGVSLYIWGTFLWGEGFWGSTAPKVVQRPIYWSKPIQFKQMSLQLTGTSTAGMILGNVYAAYKPLGYQTAQQG